MTYSLAVVTPTCARDLAHFGLLRRSLEAFAPQLTHVAIVQTEDLPAFAGHRNDPGLQLLSTADLLPADIERERRKRAGRSMRLNRLERSLQKRFGWFPRASCDGWHVQQLTKFEASRRLPYDGLLVLDSDAFLTRPFRFEDLLVDGLRPIYASWQAGVTPNHWLRAAHALWRQPLPESGQYWYVSQPYLFERQTMQGLCAHLEAMYQRPWMEALLAMKPGDLSEFNIYGVYAQQLAPTDGRCVVAGDPRTRWIFSKGDRLTLKACLDEAFSADGNIQFVILQSDRHWPIEPWREEILDRIHRATGAPA